jgi:hypothetical protein
MARKFVLVVGLALAVALISSACSQEEERPATQPVDAVAARLRDCRTVGHDARGVLLLCQQRGSDRHGAFVVNDGSGRRVLPVGSPGATATATDAGLVGHWEWASLSPDGSTFLAQWSAECEIPIAFLVPAEGGKPRVVTGEGDWATSPSSVALGWTTDGRAIVLFPESNPCGTVGSPGLYLVALDGTHTRARELDAVATKLPRSVRPRSAATLARR